MKTLSPLLTTFTASSALTARCFQESFVDVMRRKITVAVRAESEGDVTDAYANSALEVAARPDARFVSSSYLKSTPTPSHGNGTTRASYVPRLGR